MINALRNLPVSDENIRRKTQRQREEEESQLTESSSHRGGRSRATEPKQREKEGRGRTRRLECRKRRHRGSGGRKREAHPAVREGTTDFFEEGKTAKRKINQVGRKLGHKLKEMGQEKNGTESDPSLVLFQDRTPPQITFTLSIMHVPLGQRSLLLSLVGHFKSTSQPCTTQYMENSIA